VIEGSEGNVAISSVRVGDGDVELGLRKSKRCDNGGRVEAYTESVGINYMDPSQSPKKTDNETTDLR
jgi:hypothetical protein